MFLNAGKRDGGYEYLLNFIQVCLIVCDKALINQKTFSCSSLRISRLWTHMPGSYVKISYNRERCFGTRERHGEENSAAMETRRQIIPIKYIFRNGSRERVEGKNTRFASF